MNRLLLVFVVLLGIAGCSDSTNGAPTPSPGSTTPGSSASPPMSSPTSPPDDSPMAGIDPCSLLTDAAQSQLGISGGEPGTTGAARSCDWRQRGVDVTTFIGVDILDDRGLGDLPATANPQTIPDIGKHKARSTEGGDPDSCSISIGVSEKSRVDISVLVRSDRAKSCLLTDQIAQLVEPELP